MQSRMGSATLLAFGLAVGLPGSGVSASLMGLDGIPGAHPGNTYALSGNGSVVVGVLATPTVFEAFRMVSGEDPTGLGDLPGGIVSSAAYAASGDGSVVVGRSFSAASSASGSADGEAFCWTAEEGMIGLGDLPGGSFSSWALDVSGDGSTIVGFGSSSRREAFRWTVNGGMVGLGDLPGGSEDSRASAVSGDGSVVVGWSRSANGDEAFRWTASTGMVGLGSFPGDARDFRSQAYDVSRDGTVIVGNANSLSGIQAFRWTEADGFVGLGDLPGGTFVSEAKAVSGDGTVVVGSSRSEGDQQRAFVWTAAAGMQSIDFLLASLGVDVSGWELFDAVGISDDGRTILGLGIDPDGNFEPWIAVIPEPSTALLIGFGLAGLALRTRGD